MLVKMILLFLILTNLHWWFVNFGIMSFLTAGFLSCALYLLNHGE